MIYIDPQDQERLLRMAAGMAANLAVEVLLSTEPFKSSMRPPRLLEIEPLPKPKRRRRKPKAKA
jgi:hypothetical protein